MTEREKIHSGEIYWPSDESIMTEQLGYLDLMDEYNRTPRRLQKERQEMLKQLFAEVGENCYIESPYLPTGAVIMFIWAAISMPMPV